MLEVEKSRFLAGVDADDTVLALRLESDTLEAGRSPVDPCWGMEFPLWLRPGKGIVGKGMRG
jgi:hypothetical protein